MEVGRVKKEWKKLEGEKKRVFKKILNRFSFTELNEDSRNQIIDTVFAKIQSQSEDLPKTFDDYETFCQKLKKTGLRMNALEWILFAGALLWLCVFLSLLFMALAAVFQWEGMTVTTLMTDGFQIQLESILASIFSLIVFSWLNYILCASVFRSNGIRWIPWACFVVVSIVLLRFVPDVSFMLPFFWFIIISLCAVLCIGAYKYCGHYRYRVHGN